MTKFVDDDQGYLAWVVAHPGGYVVNCGRTPTPAYLILHRAGCRFIRTSRRSNWTTGQYIKVCSEDLGDLRQWASSEVDGELQPCRSCSPLSGPSTGGQGTGKHRGKKEGPGVGSGSNRWPAAKSIVEFLAALIAVIGAIVALVQWLLKP